MAGKPSRAKRKHESNEAEDTRPKGPAAVGVQKHQGTRKHRRQRAN